MSKVVGMSALEGELAVMLGRMSLDESLLKLDKTVDVRETEVEDGDLMMEMMMVALLMMGPVGIILGMDDGDEDRQDIREDAGDSKMDLGIGL